MGGMSEAPRLSPEDQAYVDEKTRRMVAVAALRKVQRLVDDYREGGAPIELRSRGGPADLPEEVRAAVPPHARRVAGLAAMIKIQQLARRYREQRAADNRTALRIACVFAVLCAAIVALILVAPEKLHPLLRFLS